MGVVIDTSVLIDLEKGRIKYSDNVTGRENEDFFISVITVSELLHGVLRAEDPKVRNSRSAFVESLISSIPVLPLDVSVARAHAQLWAELKSQGIMIGLHDSWIAAICIAHGYSLITSNIREFGRVPGLRSEFWAMQQ